MLYPTKFASLVILLTSLTLQACGGGGSNSSAPVTPPVTPDPADPVTPDPDTTKPVITLNGDASLSIEQGTAYIEDNATAVDAVDGSVDVVVSGTVGADAGVYTLTYTAVDAAGNSESITRTVTVTAVEVEPEPTTDDTFILNDGVVDAIWGGDAQLSFFDGNLGYSDADAN